MLKISLKNHTHTIRPLWANDGKIPNFDVLAGCNLTFWHE